MKRTLLVIACAGLVLASACKYPEPTVEEYATPYFAGFSGKVTRV